MQDEENLVRRAQYHDQEAFIQLYEEHFDKIYRYVTFKIGNEPEAEDITQRVFLNALQSISSFKRKGIPFSAWLFRIAHNQVVDHLRRKRHTAVPLDESLASNDTNPQLVVEQKLDIEQLLWATKQLTEAQREVISPR